VKNVLASQGVNNLKIYVLILTTIIALVLCIPALAQSDHPPVQEPLVLTDQQGEYPLGRSMDILEDPGGELTIDDVTSSELTSQFVPSTVDAPVFGYTSSVFWLRLRLRNESTLTNQWLLEGNFPNLNYVDLYLPAEEGGYQVKQTGALLPFATRDIPYYHIIFNLPLANQDEQSFYIRVESGSSMTLAFTLWSPQAFATYKINDMLLVGLFYGSLLIMLGYHLFVLYSLKEVNYLYFVLFLASAILFFATYEGVADQFLWRGFSEYKRLLVVIAMALFFMSSLKFGDLFLELKTHAPRFHHLSNLLIGFWSLLIVIVPFFSYGFMGRMTVIGVIITPLFAAVAGFYTFRKGFHPAFFYLVSWLGFFLGVVIVELVRLGIVPSTPFTEKAYHSGLIWLVLLSSLGLADRINQLKKGVEDANRKLLQSERKLTQTLDGLPIGVVVYGQERKPTYLNRRAAGILENPNKGIRPDITAGRTLADAMKYFSFRISGTDQEYPIDRMPVWQAFDGKSFSVDDIEADLVDWRVPLEIWANPVMNEKGEVESVVAAFQDITQRKRVADELEQYRLRLEELVSDKTSQLTVTNQKLQAENSERLRLENILRSRLSWLMVVSQVHQAVVVESDLPGAYKSFADVITRLFGASGALLADLNKMSGEIKLIAHSCVNNAHHDLTGSTFSLPTSLSVDQLLGNSKPIQLSRDQLDNLDEPLGTHFRNTDSQILVLLPLHCQESIIGLLGLEFLETEKTFSAEDMTLIDSICLDLLQLREKVRLLDQSRALTTAEERNRLARDLHDSVTQVLFAASLVAEVLPQIWDRDPIKAMVSLEELRCLTRGALAEMRTMLLELRPAAVIKTPLCDLLAQLAEAITSRTNLRYQLFVEKTPPLPEEVHIGFYRIAQESLNNVVKHARASQAVVSLSIFPHESNGTEPWEGELKLMVRDDGLGFDIMDKGIQHLGLTIMRERAALIGATLSVESLPGKGTTVILTWQPNGRKNG
jgi:signal transduction histidine kinase